MEWPRIVFLRQMILKCPRCGGCGDEYDCGGLKDDVGKYPCCVDLSRKKEWKYIWGCASGIVRNWERMDEFKQGYPEYEWVQVKLFWAWVNTSKGSMSMSEYKQGYSGYSGYEHMSTWAHEGNSRNK